MLNRFTLQKNFFTPGARPIFHFGPRFSGVVARCPVWSWLNKDTTVGGDWNNGILNDFPIILGIMILTDELIFFRGVETTNQDI